MGKFNVGDRVFLRKDSEWNNGSDTNPLDTVGEITRISKEEDLNHYVYWNAADIGNVYKEEDLELVSERRDINTLAEELGVRWDDDKVVYLDDGGFVNISKLGTWVNVDDKHSLCEPEEIDNLIVALMLLKSKLKGEDND